MKHLRWVVLLSLLGCDHDGFPDRYIRYTIANQSDYDIEVRTFFRSPFGQTFALPSGYSLVRDSLVTIVDEVWPAQPDAFRADSIALVFPDGKALSYPCSSPPCNQERLALDFYFDTR